MIEGYVSGKIIFFLQIYAMVFWQVMTCFDHKKIAHTRIKEALHIVKALDIARKYNSFVWCSKEFDSIRKRKEFSLWCWWHMVVANCLYCDIVITINFAIFYFYKIDVKFASTSINFGCFNCTVIRCVHCNAIGNKLFALGVF